MIDERDIVQRAVDRLAPPEPALERLLRRRDRTRRNQRIAAGAVGVAVVAGMVWVIATRATIGPGETPTGTDPSVAPTPAGEIPGLPAEGATPSAPRQGELVLSLEGSTGGPWSFLWVYDDGRLVWHRQDYVPPSAFESPTGMFEQRLTPSGIEFLRSEVVSTGMFEDTLALARGPDQPMLSVRVRNGDRLVRVTWAWRQNFRIPPGSPPATAEQANILEGLHERITEPDAWPTNAWEDREIVPYVPRRYAVCPRGFPNEIRADRAWSLLPEAAQDLREATTEPQEGSLPEGDCTVITTEDARGLAEILDRARIERNGDEGFPGEDIWLKYLVDDPDDPGNEIWFSFVPLLPHGEGIFLGPG